MKKPFSELEVWSMLQAAASQLTENGKISKPSISSLCRQAGISRAHLYATFPQLVDRLRLAKRSQVEKKLAERLTQLDDENRELKHQNAVLARTCLELKLSILRGAQQTEDSRRR